MSRVGMQGALAPILETMIKRDASDLYLTVGYPPAFRYMDTILKEENAIALTQEAIEQLLNEILNDEKSNEFLSTLELNLAITWQEESRFRVNVFRQQHHTGIVIRRIKTEIPTLESLGLPPLYAQLAMRKKGLVLIASPSGSGKSTSLAAMVGHRNKEGSGHIITIEDPIEFIHEHQGCIITQREVGIDTYSYGMALKNALRQRADVVVIGEIRDRETMEHAINFAETGHLCIATLHSNNAPQAIERVINFFPEEFHKHALATLSQNLEAILSQKLIPNKQSTRTIAIEIMLNVGLIRNLIYDGKIIEIRDHMEKQQGQGMQTFDMALLELYQKGIITEEAAIAEAENAANLRLRIRQTQPSKADFYRKPTSEF